MEKLFRLSGRLIRSVSLDFQRYLFREIDWSDRMIAITGPRGVGKTTLILQYIRQNLPMDRQVLYISLDDLYFQYNLLSDLVEDFVAMGGRYLFVDEVHKYPNWSFEMKNIYDAYPELKIVFSGSSLLQIYKGQADLSRRVSVYQLSTLSFREFLYFKTNYQFPVLKMDEILHRHEELSQEVLQKVKPLYWMESFLQTGMYPFFTESTSRYEERLNQTLLQILEKDIAEVAELDFRHVRKIKQLLYVISTSAPFTPNISTLANRTGMERRTVYKYIDLLEKAAVIRSLYTNKKGMSALGKPEKIYLHNPNLMWLFASDKPDKGNERETFFLNQLQVKHKLQHAKETDFLVDGKIHFEIGGKNKDQNQIKNLRNAYIVADNLELGLKNKIPLWLFGFLY